MKIDCSHGWEDRLNFRTWDAISNLHEYFNKNIVARKVNISWYTLALTEELATMARNQIYNSNKVKYIDHVFRGIEYKDLSPCEQKILKHQEIINRLGYHLQCTSSAALIAADTFFVNVMPTIDEHTSLKMQMYIDAYNKEKSQDAVMVVLGNQVKCANRTLNTVLSQYNYSENSKATMRWLFYMDIKTSYSRGAHNDFIRLVDEKSSEIIREYMKKKYMVCK